MANIGGTNAGASGAVAVGNTATETLTLGGTVYNTNETQTYTAKTGGGNIDITGAATFTTSADNIEFATSGVDLSANVTITTGTGANIGDVDFGGAIETDNGSRTLTITSGAGDVTFSKAIGLTNSLGGLDVNSTAGDGDGDIIFTKAIGDTSAGVSGTTTVGNSATNQIRFLENTYTFAGGVTTFTTATGDKIKLEKGAATTFTTAGTAINFAGGTIKLSDGSDLTVNSVGLSLIHI